LWDEKFDRPVLEHGLTSEHHTYAGHIEVVHWRNDYVFAVKDASTPASSGYIFWGRIPSKWHHFAIKKHTEEFGAVKRLGPYELRILPSKKAQAEAESAD